MSKVKLLKSKKGVDSTNIITDQNALVSKPPPLPKSQRSEYFSQRDEGKIDRADSEINSKSENMGFSPSINSAFS